MKIDPSYQVGLPPEKGLNSSKDYETIKRDVLFLINCSYGIERWGEVLDEKAQKVISKISEYVRAYFEDNLSVGNTEKFNPPPLKIFFERGVHDQPVNH